MFIDIQYPYLNWMELVRLLILLGRIAMNVNWKKMISLTLAWLASEIVLGYFGLDSIADYCEFIDGRCHDAQLKQSNRVGMRFIHSDCPSLPGLG